MLTGAAMKYVQNYAEVFASRLNVDQVSLHRHARHVGERSTLPVDGCSAGSEPELTPPGQTFDLGRIIGGALFSLLLISGIIAVAIEVGGALATKLGLFWAGRHAYLALPAIIQ